MRCFYCARQERVSGDGVAVAICKRCGGGICLEHLWEVRHDRRHTGVLGQASGQSVELLCLGCAGLTTMESPRPKTTGRLAESATTKGTSPSALSSSTREEGEPAWTDPASVVVAAEAYLERLRAPSSLEFATTTPDTTLIRWGTLQWWRQCGRRWFDSCRQRFAGRMRISQPPQR
jgi:hypothetical protein